MKCDSCGTRIERWISLEEIPRTPCPRCGNTELKRVYSSFSTGSSCGIRKPGRWAG
jgi:putative FmdB family regulatory protein